MTDIPFELSERDRQRIDLLLALIAQDWKRTGPDQHLFQYLADLARSLGCGDLAMIQDDALIEALLARAGHDGGQDGQHNTELMLAKAAEQRQFQVAAARLRCITDRRLNKESPRWVVDLANEDL